MPLSAGDKLGPYEILSPLGAGGMGEVYRARDSRLDRDVAVKVMKDRRPGFEQEARAAAALNHPNIVAVYDVGPDYVVMELVEGESLRQVLRRGALSFREVIEVGAQITDGLAAAHAVQIVHRDLKPENIICNTRLARSFKRLWRCFRVRGTIRSLKDDEKVQTMRRFLSGVELVEADLRSPAG